MWILSKCGFFMLAQSVKKQRTCVENTLMCCSVDSTPVQNTHRNNTCVLSALVCRDQVCIAYASVCYAHMCRKHNLVHCAQVYHNCVYTPVCFAHLYTLIIHCHDGAHLCAFCTLSTTVWKAQKFHTLQNPHKCAAFSQIVRADKSGWLWA